VKTDSTNFRRKLKKIPSVDELISYCMNQFKIVLPHTYLKKIINAELISIKSLIKEKKIVSNIKEKVYEVIIKKVKFENMKKLSSVINGTGIILHTGLGRAPIDKNLLLQGVNDIYPYGNLEYNIIDNKRGERNNHVNYLVNSLAKSEASLVVNNNAAAVMLALNTFAENKEVIISRGQLIEIGGSFRIPDVIKKANCTMVEVGTTNKTHLKDYKDAINENTGMIMVAHTSNYKVVGFTKSVELNDLALLAESKKIPLFVDVGSGAIINYDKFALPKEKMISEYIKMGVDIVSFSGDKLIGGPQTGILCGKKSRINKIHSNSMYRALRCDKITISILELILKSYIDENNVHNTNLTFHLLTRNRKELKKIGNKILKKINVSIIKNYDLKLVETFVQAGSGSLPTENIESIAFVFNSKKIPASALSFKFRNSKIPTIGYIKNKLFYIDLKAIPEDQINSLIKIINFV